MSRLAVCCVALLSATTLAAACSVYDESLVGAGGVDDTTSTRSGDGDGDGGRGGAGPTTTSDGSTSDASTSDSSTGQSGSVTTGAQCDTPDDCPGQDSECSERSCEGNQCSIINKEAGFVLTDQFAGDCIEQVCDGQGNVLSEVDDEDLPTQTNECVVPTCTNGVPGEVDAEQRDPCGDDDLCDGNGVCVECLGDEDCPESCSESRECVDAECDDGDQNGDETDVDCGGGECSDCPNGDTCLVDGDCLSNECAATCQPSCSDGILNNEETGIDCGGGECGQCVLGSACDVDTDCDSDQCMANVCRPRIFFSEYVEGDAAANKAVEIFNYGNVPLDLGSATCRVRLYSNGNSQPQSNIALSGTVADFGTHVLCNRDFFSPPSPDPPDPDSPCIVANGGQVNGSLSFNGNDAMALECDGVVLDVFGQIGFDPGIAWGSGSTSTVDNTLRRNGGVTEGDTNGSNAFVPSAEWTGFGADAYTGLGDHP